MSEKGSEPDIAPRRVNVAEVPLADSCFALVHRQLESGVFDPNADIRVCTIMSHPVGRGNSGQPDTLITRSEIREIEE
jgi:hypothetical protein